MSNNLKQSFEHRIDDLIERIERLQKQANDSYSDETISDLCRYLCVLIAGYFEKMLVNKLIDYASVRTSQSIARFVRSSIDKTTNLSKDKVETLLGKFDPTWNDSLSKWSCFDTYVSHLGTIYGNRNKIAHGENTAVTISTLKDCYDSFKNFFDKLNTIVV